MSVRRRPKAADPLAARRSALRVLLDAGSGQLRFDMAFEREMQRRPLPERDRALALALASGCLKLRRKLDFILEQFVLPRHRPLPFAIQQILRLGIFQLLELSRVPRFAAVSTSVDLAKQWGHAGTAGLVNAVLRRVADHSGEWIWPDIEQDPVNHLGTVYSYPNWLVRHWLEEVGVESALRWCRLGNVPAGLTLRRVRDASWSGAQIAALDKVSPGSRPGLWFEDFRFLPNPPAPESLVPLTSGEATVQNEAGAVAVALLELGPGDVVVEIGAAPGGKSMRAARLVGAQGAVIAIDHHPRRMRRLVENCRRTRLERVLPVRADGRYPPLSVATKILVDAPCSGLGLLHRHPDLRWAKDITDIKRLAEIQHQLILAAFEALAPGGRLVYSTCTTTRLENEAQISRLLELRKDASIVDPRPVLPRGIPAGPTGVRIEPDPPQIDGAFACAVTKAAA